MRFWNGLRRATRIEKFIDDIEHHEDAGQLASMLSGAENKNGNLE